MHRIGYKMIIASSKGKPNLLKCCWNSFGFMDSSVKAAVCCRGDTTLEKGEIMKWDFTEVAELQ